MFKKLRNKLLLVNMTIITLIIVISFAIIYGLTTTSIHGNNFQRLEKLPMPTNELIREPNSEGHRFYNDTTLSFTMFLNEEKQLEKLSSNLDLTNEEYEEILNTITSWAETTGKIEISNKTWLYNLSKIPNMEFSNNNDLENIEYKLDFIDISETISNNRTLLITLIIVGIITLIVIYFVLLIFANRSIKPIENMWYKQKEFIANATHELKTPLTIINANVDVLEMNEDKKIKTQLKWLSYIKEQTKGMNKLITDLLTTAKEEQLPLQIEKVNIKELIENTLLQIEAISYEKNIKLNTNLSNIETKTDKEKLKQVLTILLDNAIKYTNETGYITINLKKKNLHTYIKVINSGKGINEKDLPNIFDRFYKGDKARTNKDNSYGLGLFIAKEIITNLNGNISVKSTRDKETIFTIKL